MKKYYINGNYLVSYRDRTHTRNYTALRRNEEFVPEFPDSIDLKITNKCSNNCPYCHESSNSSGKSFNLQRTIEILDNLPSGIEVAIGGGNIIECSDDFIKLCEYLTKRGISPRVTINHRDLEKFLELYNNLLFNSSSKRLAIGISIESYEDYLRCIEIINTTNTSCFYLTFVYHIIVGIFPYNDLEKLLNATNGLYCSKCRVLVLGFKQFGKAINQEIKDLDSWRETISSIVYKKRKNYINPDSEYILGFDNLAIDQLNIKDLLLKSEWEAYFMGQDFSHTMYVDAVREEFAPTSRSPIEDRQSWDSINIIDYFKKYRESWS